MRKLFKERKLFKGGNYMRKYGTFNWKITNFCVDYHIRHGLLNIWTELLYLTFPHEADLLTLIMSHKLTQYLLNFKKIHF